jgi:hypothetical protein
MRVLQVVVVVVEVVLVPEVVGVVSVVRLLFPRGVSSDEVMAAIARLDARGEACGEWGRGPLTTCVT